MHFKDSFNRNQLIALGTVAFLAPALRLLPGRPAELAGRACWLAPVLAAPCLLLYAFFLCRLMEKRGEGEGLAELTLRALGQKAGAAALLLFSLWLLLYAGFILRSGADRLITTIYPQSGPGFFTVVMGLICLLAALGAARSFVRVAKMVLPLILGTLLLILLFGLGTADKTNLLPLTYHDFGPVALSSLAVVDVICVIQYTACFFVGMTPKEAGPMKVWSLWLGLLCLLLAVLSMAVVGSFGPELSSRLTRPFFSLVRNLVFFNSLERIEALVVTLWVFPDFLLETMLLFAAQLCLRLVMGKDPVYRRQGLTDLGEGRWVIWLCGAVSIAVGLLIGRSPERLSFWSNVLIPLANLSVAFLLIPLVYLAGRLRKTL